ncbi:MAG: apolipoprotein N-acyltransferase [Rhodobacterales bacterium]|nr:MAG: apolipoprotein N-acyltransferase [Rhodobacterales bacterium]
MGRKTVLALFFGLLTGVGQAPFAQTWFAILGLSAVFGLFLTTVSIRQAAWLGWAFGTGYFGLVLNWIVEPFLVDVARHGWMAPFALVGLAAGLALFWALAFGLAKKQGSLLALAVFLTLAELARSYVLTGFPWGLLGYIWLDRGLDQLASVIGPHGLTLLTLLGVWALVGGIRRRSWGALTGLLAGFAGLLAYGLWLAGAAPVPRPDAPIVRLIQPNAPQHQKWDPMLVPMFFQRSLSLTAAAAKPRPDLIIWPETSVPYLLNRSTGPLAQMTEAAGGAPVVFGVQRRDGPRYLNALAVLDRDGVVSTIYDKAHLVPFGEYIPAAALAKRLGITGLADQDGFGFGAGPGLRLLDLPGLGRALPLICYEAIFPHEVVGAPRGDFLLQITNDAWFGNLTGPQQHLAQTRFRAIELGLPMVRAANTGISAVIDGRGRITTRLALGQAGFVDAPLPAALPATIYAKTGDTPLIILLLIATAGLLFSRRQS